METPQQIAAWQEQFDKAEEGDVNDIICDVNAVKRLLKHARETNETIAELRAELNGQRMCLNCGKFAPKGHPREEPLPECVGPDGLSACTFQLTPEEAWEHWRKVAHDQMRTIAALNVTNDLLNNEINRLRATL